MMRIYRAPTGRTYQYEEGAQPDGYEPVGAKAPAKRRTTQNKRRTAKDKGATDEP